MTTRREFLKNSAIAASGLLLSPALAAQTWIGKKPQVIIMGAGLSGLAAARVLQQRGIGYTLLEAQHRLGGRVFSHQMGNLTVELGGEWIGDSHERMCALCQEFRLDLDNNQMASGAIYKGRYFPKAESAYSPEWTARIAQLLDDYRELPEADKRLFDRYDWWRYLVNNGCTGRDLDLRELSDSTDFGESIRHVSAFAALEEYAMSSEKNEMDYKIAGGNELLAHRIADKIGRQHIHLQHKVTRVVQHSNGVRVYCANGKMFEADKLICTLPTVALRHIQWEPGLAQNKVDAINQLQYARINKHAVLFDRRFWPREDFDLLTDQLPHYFYHATKNQRSSQGVLISYTIGDKAAVIANQDPAVNARHIVQTLQPHFGDIGPLIAKQENFYWGNHEYTRGAYALYQPGQWFDLMPVLREDFLHTSFAGEHIADWQGFMEGAVVTGETAALKI